MGTDADTRYLARVHEDCERVLGPGVEILGIDWWQAAPVTLTIRYRLDGVDAVTTGEGDTVIAAHTDLRQRLVIDRVKLGFTVLTEPAF
jgi:hypothetical protein